MGRWLAPDGELYVAMEELEIGVETGEMLGDVDG